MIHTAPEEVEEFGRGERGKLSDQRVGFRTIVEMSKRNMVARGWHAAIELTELDTDGIFNDIRYCFKDISKRVDAVFFSHHWLLV